MEEKTYKWRWDGYSSTKEPERKEVLRDTESTIWHRGFDHNGNAIDTKERKWTDYHKWFDTRLYWLFWRMNQDKKKMTGFPINWRRPELKWSWSRPWSSQKGDDDA